VKRLSILGRGTLLAATAGLAIACSGCQEEGGSIGRLDHVWGRRGTSDGRLTKPRGMAIDPQDRLYLVDFTARIQVFNADGEFLRGWQTPVHENGRPTGISIDRQGRVVVPDTHYFRVLFYSPEGVLLDTWGAIDAEGNPRQGHGPGEFGLVTDVVQDSQGFYYVSEYGEYDRIQKFTPAGRYVLEWGGHGDQPGRFRRPQSMAIDPQDRIWVADSCNHRIQVFDTEGHLLFYWGVAGAEPGRLRYPYSLAFDADGNLVICEYGNHRVQKFTADGRALGWWGTNGRQEGQTHNPWAVVVDSRGRVHVLDTNNHRVQRIVM
jgi:DNA-binding beta-propeller fold protein YncE